MKSDEVRALISVIGPLLHGHDPAVVSAVLADLTAMLLAGFQGEDREQARDALFKQHVELVIGLYCTACLPPDRQP